MLIVSSLERAQEAFQNFQPTHIISILSEDEPRPVFEGLDKDHHLKLYVECETGPAAHNITAKQRTQLIVSSFENWADSEKILVHCAKGVSRSMAAAFILLCMAYPEKSEADIAREIRKAAPHADPCLFMIDHADEVLNRNGRMFDAIDDLPPSQTTIDAPIVLLPVAA